MEGMSQFRVRYLLGNMLMDLGVVFAKNFSIIVDGITAQAPLVSSIHIDLIKAAEEPLPKNVIKVNFLTKKRAQE